MPYVKVAEWRETLHRLRVAEAEAVKQTKEQARLRAALLDKLRPHIEEVSPGCVMLHLVPEGERWTVSPRINLGLEMTWPCAKTHQACLDAAMERMRQDEQVCDSREAHNVRVAEAGMCDLDHSGLPNRAWAQSPKDGGHDDCLRAQLNAAEEKRRGKAERV